jgi:NAD+ kinase
MLHARVLFANGEEKEDLPFHALNDLVVGRSAISRLVHLETRVDGALVATYHADAVIVATATGSTGYALSVGGPILHPQSSDLLLKPVAPHLGLTAALVLAPDSVVEITLRSDYPAALSLDGRPDLALAPGETVQVKRSPYTTRFLRANPQSHFYSTLTKRLNPDAGHTDPRTTPLI